MEKIEILRSQRKSLSIEVLSSDKILVKAPFYCADQHIYNFVEEKQAWILKKQAFLSSYQDLNTSFKTNDTLHYLGKSYQIQEAKVKRPSFADDIFLIPAMLESLTLKKMLTRFFKEKALDILQDRLHFYADHMMLFPSQFLLSNAKARWGSCTSKGVIRLNWRLVFAPLYAVDYVVIHELAHLKEMNHGPNFWALVKRFDANYKDAEAWLKGHRQLLRVLR